MAARKTTKTLKQPTDAFVAAYGDDPWGESTCPLHSARDGFCNWCGKQLRGRQTRWCSRQCSRTATINHRWTQAKAAAKQRVRIVLYTCERCGELVDKVEVNHLVPCVGRHGVWGCWHHQPNLTVLCVPCHREVTKEQRALGVI